MTEMQLQEFSDDDWISGLAFLAEMARHLNYLDVKVQRNISYKIIYSVILKLLKQNLNLWERQI
jgi:hypothetical protein